MAVSTEKAYLNDGVIDARYVAKFQRRHVFLCNLLPLLGSLVTVGLAIHHPPQWGKWLCLAVPWLVIGMGVTVGYHRYFTHQAFETGSSVRMILAILGSMSAQGPLVAWVSTHRRHHQLQRSRRRSAFAQLEWAGASRPFEGYHARPFRLDDLACRCRTRCVTPEIYCATGV